MAAYMLSRVLSNNLKHSNFNVFNKSITYTANLNSKGPKRPFKVARTAEKFLGKYVNRQLGGKTKAKRNVFMGGEAMTSSLAGSSHGWSKSKASITLGMQRRSHHLSSVFYEYITSLINSGEVDSRLQHFDLEILKVRMASDFSQINVYWLASGSNKDEELENLLPEIGFKLRHQLTGLHIIGRVPPIVFVKDLSVARLQEVERLLEKADFGADYEPSDPVEDMKEVIKVNATTPSLQQHIDIVKKKMLEKDTQIYDIERDLKENSDMVQNVNDIFMKRTSNESKTGKVRELSMNKDGGTNPLTMNKKGAVNQIKDKNPGKRKLRRPDNYIDAQLSNLNFSDENNEEDEDTIDEDFWLDELPSEHVDK